MITRKDIDSAHNYEEKLRLIKTPLLNFASSRIYDFNSAEDVVQDVLLILCQKKNEFDINKSFYSWAFKICRFQIKKYLTLKKRNREDSYANVSDFMSDLEHCPVYLINDKEEKSELKKTIDFLKTKLPPQQKKIFKYITDGMSRKAARAAMDLKISNFNLTYCRTIQGCKKIIDYERKKAAIPVK